MHALLLRQQGKTYRDIQNILQEEIPKSTLALWCKWSLLSEEEKENIKIRGEEKILEGRMKAALTNKKKKQERIREIFSRVAPLKNRMEDDGVAKISLAMLYLCEGTKKDIGTCCFCNSDPAIIRLFLRLVRKCYKVNEGKLHITVQCRADQDTEALMSYWSGVTNIPLKQFYPARIDPRTVGKPTKKVDYKGVCRVDYFSAALYNELKIIGSLF